MFETNPTQQMTQIVALLQAKKKDERSSIWLSHTGLLFFLQS